MKVYVTQTFDLVLEVFTSEQDAKKLKAEWEDAHPDEPVHIRPRQLRTGWTSR